MSPPLALATLPALAGLRSALEGLRGVPLDARYAPEAEVLEWARLAAELRRIADAHVAASAGEIARHSSPELGRDGLARKAGARTVEEVFTSSGMTGRDAATAVRVGRLTTGDALPGVGQRVLDGTVSVVAADAIRAGLDGTGAPQELVEHAAELLCDEADTLAPDALLKRAREVRDELDETGITGREAAPRAQRSLRRIDMRNGMKRLIWDYDPETAGIVDDIYDRITSPRRGGPRFIDPDQAAHAEQIEKDPRTTAQLASDGFAELLRQSASVDENVLLGNGTPGVKILVPAGADHGVIEGTGEAVSTATAERIACAHGTQRITLDLNGNPLDVGREQRFFTVKQRTALAIRDGGCLWPGCDRPPSWTEAHHTNPWATGGRTDLADGVLLCRHHHLRLHNEKWTIRRSDNRYWLHPPGTDREPVPLETKSRALREHLTRTG